MFKAQYTQDAPIVYNVKFLDYDDEVIADINATDGSSIQVPDAPPIPNYTFTSWIEVGGTERISSSETHYTVTRDVIFKAQYVAIIYTATFLKENGVVEANLSGTYGSSITVPNAPPKSGYTFTQWKELGGSETISNSTTSYALTRDITFKAEYVDSFDGTHIYTQANLNKVRNNLSGNYMLMNDIALSDNGAGYDDSGWQPIGTQSNKFTGTFNGNGHKITGLWIDRADTNYVGLFGFTNGATIKNLGVEISSRGVKGYGAVGGIAGQMYNSSITNSYSTGSVSGNSGNVGGIVGVNSAGSITNNAAINPSVSSAYRVNRVVGYIPSGTASNNFALNTMTVTGSTDGNAGTSKTITELTTQSTYSNWNFGNNEAYPWKIDPYKNDGLPYLYWENR
jgi:hypothetical protein